MVSRKTQPTDYNYKLSFIIIFWITKDAIIMNEKSKTPITIWGKEYSNNKYEKAKIETNEIAKITIIFKFVFILLPVSNFDIKP